MEDPEYQAFLDLDLGPYSGEWVAICGSKVVCHAKSFNAVFKEAKKKCLQQRPAFAKVPGKEAWIF